MNGARLYATGRHFRQISVALALVATTVEGSATSPVPAAYTVDIGVRQGGDYLVVHAMQTLGATGQIQCALEWPVVQCRSNGRTVITASVARNNVRIMVYINPPWAVEDLLSQVISAAKANPTEVTGVVAWGPDVPAALKSLAAR